MREEELVKSLDIILHGFWERKVLINKKKNWKHLKGFAKEKEVIKQIRKLIQVDVDEIIQVVLDHAECHHNVDHDEDGTHVDVEYQVKDGCHEAVRKVLGVEE